jgi:hypothetical protein
MLGGENLKTLVAGMCKRVCIIYLPSCVRTEARPKTQDKVMPVLNKTECVCSTTSLVSGTWIITVVFISLEMPQPLNYKVKKFKIHCQTASQMTYKCYQYSLTPFFTRTEIMEIYRHWPTCEKHYTIRTTIMSNTEDYSKLLVWIFYCSETPKNIKWY